MAPTRRKGSGKGASAAAAALQQWKVGDLVLAKMKGFPAWPAMITDPEKWGYSTSKKKVLVFFFGTKQIAFCNHADIEVFTEEKKKILLGKRQGKGADFVRAVEEIIDGFDKLSQKGDEEIDVVSENFASNSGSLQGSSCRSESRDLDGSFQPITVNQPDDHNASKDNSKNFETREYSGSPMRVDDNLSHTFDQLPDKSSMLDELRQTPLATSSRKRSRDKLTQRNDSEKKLASIRRSRSSKRADPTKLQCADLAANQGSVIDIVLEPIVKHDECGPENIPHDKSDNSVSHNVVLPVSIGTVIYENGTDKFVEAELGAKSLKRNVSQQLKKDEQLIVNYLNGISKAKMDEGDQIGTIVLKKNRKSWTKRVSHSLASEKLDQHSIQNDNQKDAIASRNLDKSTNEIVGDGDGHLPLVKRARARMREPPVKDKREETMDVKFEKETLTNIHDNNNLSSMNEHLSSDICKPEPVLTSYDSIQDNEVDVPKVKKFQLTSCIDVEAALPPSKRLHRALEAMSANVAEASNDDTEVPGVHEKTSDECCDSSLVGSVVPVDCRTIEIAHDVQSSSCPEVLNSASEVSCENPSKVETSSDANPDDICLETSVTSQHKGPDENVCDKENNTSPNVPPATREAFVKSAYPSTSDGGDKKVSDTSFQGGALNEANISPDVRPTPTNIDVKSPQPSTCDGCDKMVNDVSCQSKEEQSPQVTENGGLSQGDGSMSFPSSVKVIELELKPGCKGSASHMDYVPRAKDASNDSFRVSGRTQGSLSNVVNENAKSSSLTTDKSGGLSLKLQAAWELKQMSAPKDLAFSPDSTPMKVLIAAAQAKRLLSRSSSLSDSVADTKPSSSFPSPSTYCRENSSDRMNHFQGRSPDPSPRQRCSSQQLSANDLRSGSAVHYQHAEANAQLKSFEALLCTLTRAKESIVRATRHAIECARIGIAGEIVQSILLNLEKEPSLHRRVDLFFLVDSITRSCRGSAGEVYPSLFLTVLPRLLSAAAPPGIAACENRRQCLKVLRLWLERKAFPDSIIRHHIRELESVNDVPFSNGFSRRPSRTERAMDDPIREMEGMLVDEYGSNTSIHLPGLLDSRIGCDEASDDDKSFEAVTPERDAKVEDDLKPSAPLIAEKHKHILEEVDGELEMEDVAPCTEMESTSSYHVRGTNTSPNSGCQFDEHQPLNFAPPLPEERPPSPPPLPSSPPPPPSVASPSSAPPPAADFVSSNDYGSTTRIHNCLPQSINSRPDGSNLNVASSQTSQYYAPGYRELSNHKLSSAPSLGPSTYGNNLESCPVSDNLSTGTAASNKTYYLQPPAPVMSNQFSYMQAEPQNPVQQPWGENNSGALTQPVHFGNDQQSGKSFNGHSPSGLVQHDRCSFAAAGPHGHVNCDKMEPPSNSLSYYGPPSAKSPLTNQGWSHPPRASSYQYHVPASRPPATSIPRMAGAPPAYWRPH